MKVLVRIPKPGCYPLQQIILGTPLPFQEFVYKHGVCLPYHSQSNQSQFSVANRISWELKHQNPNKVSAYPWWHLVCNSQKVVFHLLPFCSIAGQKFPSTGSSHERRLRRRSKQYGRKRDENLQDLFGTRGRVPVGLRSIRKQHIRHTSRWDDNVLRFRTGIKEQPIKRHFYVKSISKTIGVRRE